MVFVYILFGRVMYSISFSFDLSISSFLSYFFLCYILFILFFLSPNSSSSEKPPLSPLPETLKLRFRSLFYLSVYINLLTFQSSKCLCVPSTHRGWIHPSLSLWTDIGDWTGRLPLVLNLALVSVPIPHCTNNSSYPPYTPSRCTLLLFLPF